MASSLLVYRTYFHVMLRVLTVIMLSDEMFNHCHPHNTTNRLKEPPLYSSSLTTPCQTVFPNPTTKCPIKLPPPAPCRCVVPAGAQITPPALMRLGASPLSQIQPEPVVAFKTWPSLYVCQWVRAQGVKVSWRRLVEGLGGGGRGRRCR